MKTGVKRFSFLSWTDGMLVNNPVFEKGLMLAPLIGCKNVVSAVSIILAAAVTGIPSLVFAAFLKGRVPAWIRTALYCIFSAVMYIPACMLIDSLFGVTARTDIGIYLPMVIFSTLVSYRAEFSVYSGKPFMMLRDSVVNTLGFAIGAFSLGFLRQLLDTGIIFGIRFIKNPLTVFALPGGGLILVGLMCAVWNGISPKHNKGTKLFVSKESEQV